MNLRLSSSIFWPACAAGLIACSSPAAPLAYEPFTNTTGAAILNSSGGYGFSGAWQTNSSGGVATNTSYGLSYTDANGNTLTTLGGAAFFQGLTSANTSMQPYRLFNFSRGTNGTDGVTTWVSFLIARQGPTGTLAGNAYGRGANLAHDLNSGALQKLAVGNSSGVATNTVGLIPLGNSANLKSSTNTFGGATNFIVVRIDHVAGAANDNAWLFVNPLLSAEPSTNSASAASLGGFDFSFDRLRVFAGGQSSASQPYVEMVVDEYRLGTNYADVAPFTPANSPPVANADAFSRPRYLPLTILKSDLLTNDTDPNGDTLTLTGISPVTTNGIALATNATQIFYTNLANVADQFSYTVSDGFGGSATGTVAITVTSNVIARAQSASLGASNTLNYSGYVGYDYAVQRSLNLTNWTAIGATSPTQNLFAVTDTFADLGYRPSNAFYKLVLVPPAAPAFTLQPASLTVTQGDTANFTAAASGNPAPTWQWRKNNSALGNATNATLTIANAQSSDASNYTAVVANKWGSATSAIAALTVLIPPTISSPPASLVVTQGNNATFAVSATGTAPLGYQWSLDGAEISGATNTSFTVTNAQSADEGNYTVAVSNIAGTVTSAAAALTVLVPPSIIDQPVSQTVNTGDNAILSVNADGSSPLAYQWRLGGVALAGETSAVLTLTAVTTNDAGNYSVVITNAAGSITSAVATLTVNVPVVVTSGVLLDETWADATRTDTALPVESAWYASSASSLTVATNALTGTTGGSSSRSWWTYFTTNAAAPVTLDVGQTLKLTLNFSCAGVTPSSSSSGLRIGLYDFSGGARTTSDGSSPGGAGVSGYMIGMNFGQTFNAANPVTIFYRSNIASTALQSTSGDYTSLGSGGGGAAGSPGFSNNVPYALEFSVTRTASSVVITNRFTGANLNLLATATDTNTAAASYTYSFDGFAIRPATTTDTATNFIFTEFKVELLGSGSTNAVAPSITTQPASVTNAVGQAASFSVVASGTAPLAYQWFFNATNLLAGATNTTYTTNSVTTNLAGSYTVRVTNSVGAVTSSVATLTVTSPIAPGITTQPTNLTVAAGGSATFTVVASGTAPLAYQWFFNSTNSLTGATNSSLTLAGVQSTNAGGYSVRVTNSVGSVTSTVATLTVTAVAPSITTQPVSQSVQAGGSATFSVVASGTAPLAYQWFFNATNALAGATNSTFTTNSVTTNSAGNFTVRVTNSVGSVTSSVATLTISATTSNTAFNLYGFAQAVTGGGIVADTSASYAKVTDALGLATAVKSKTITVIEIMNNLDLGWNEIGAAAQAVGPFRVAGALPIQHPALITSGVSVLDLQRVGLTIFSANGARIRHCNFNIKSAANIIVRNLKFDEMWEWDEATKGNYDRNDWDFITIGNGGGTVSNVWIDHCTFTKSYDGETDMKGGCYNITLSWNHYVGDDGDVNTNSFVWQQINALEAGRATNTFYNFLRNNGFSQSNLVQILHGHDKTHLIGATSLQAINAQHRVTFHHQWYQNPWDRLPRLRAGNVHDYNLFVDDSAGLDARRLRDNIAAAMSSSARTTLNNTYNFQVFLNGSISTEGGAVLVENSIYQDCLTPLRNNQTDPSNPTYTGKIMALNSIYSFRNTDGTTNTYTGASTNAPGDTYFGPVQAPVIAFSWNLTSNVLPYTYVLDSAASLKSILTNSATGAGAGVLTWNKTNWLRTSY